MRSAGHKEEQLNSALVVFKREVNPYGKFVSGADNGGRAPMDYTTLPFNVKELCTKLQSIMLRCKAKKSAA